MSVEEKVDTLYSQMFEKLSKEQDDYIEIIDSENITINKSDTTIALSLQSSVSAVLAAAVQLLIADEDIADLVISDLLALTSSSHTRKKVKIIIQNCYNVTITLSAVDIMASVQLLIQTLTALLTEADIL